MKFLFNIIVILCVLNVFAEDMPSNEMNIANVRFSSQVGKCNAYYRRSDCYECTFDVLVDNINEDYTNFMKINMQKPIDVYCDCEGNITELYSYEFEEYGVYSLSLLNLNTPFEIDVDKEGHDYNIPAYIFLGSFFILLIVIIAIENIVHCVRYISTKDKTTKKNKKNKYEDAIAIPIENEITTNSLNEPLNPTEEINEEINEERTEEIIEKESEKETEKENSPATIPMEINETQDEKPKKSQLKHRKHVTKTEKTNITKHIQNDVIRAIHNHTRVASIDVFRGFALCLMIFANYGGADYLWYDHADWNGAHVADMAFPWFMFIMGASLRLSVCSRYDKYIEQYKDNKRGKIFIPFLLTLYKILLRTAILVLLNWFYNNFTNWENLRIFGVLMYFSISYCVNAIVILLVHILTNAIPKYKKFTVLFEAIIPVLLSVTYFCLERYIPLPEGCPEGYIGVGGRGDNGKYSQCTAGAHRVIDYALLGEKHLYKDPMCKGLYRCNDVDPEGILGSLHAVVLTYLGTLITYFFDLLKKTKRAPLSLFGVYLISGLLYTFLSLCLCEFKVDGGFIPINKTLWSLSFILLAAGLGYILFAFLYILIDVSRIWSGCPIKAVGMNSIFIYIAHTFVQGRVPFGYHFPTTTHTTLIISEFVMGVGMWILFANIMSYQNIYFKV